MCKEIIPAIAGDANANVAAEPEVSGANISSIKVQRLIVAVNAAKYYTADRWVMTVQNMNYTNNIKSFKEEYEAYMDLKKEAEPKVQKNNDQNSGRKVI